jgi:signal transduction histidine kinase
MLARFGQVSTVRREVVALIETCGRREVTNRPPPRRRPGACHAQRNREIRQLIVRDEGVGTPHDDLPHLFDFVPSRLKRARAFRGPCLRLASARELVELYGGATSAESEECKGTTFVVRLPLAAYAE